MRFVSAAFVELNHRTATAANANSADAFSANPQCNFVRTLGHRTIGRRLRCRSYFTSESHMYTFLNVMRLSSPNVLSAEGRVVVDRCIELRYLVHIVFRVFQPTRDKSAGSDKALDADKPKHFRVEISMSHGDESNSTSEIQAHHACVGESLPVEPLTLLASDCKLEDVISWLGESDDDVNAIAPLTTIESCDCELSPDTPVSPVRTALVGTWRRNGRAVRRVTPLL